MKELLIKRRQIKKKMPDFVMQDAHKKKKIKRRWRKPRGGDSKMRLSLKGYNKHVEPGYCSPRLVKGLDKSGLERVNVGSIGDLEKINKEKQGIIINGPVGMKKRIEIVKKAKELAIKILNIKDADKFLNDISDKIKRIKEEKEKKQKEKSEKKAKEEKKEKKKDDLAEKVMSEEEKTAAEKKEKDKILTTKE